MGETKLVTFKLDEERKGVWEEEAEDRGRSLSGFIRHAGEKLIAGDSGQTGGGVDHTEELSEIQTMIRALMGTVDGMDDTIGTIRKEISIPDDTKGKIPDVVGALPVDKGRTTSDIVGLTTEEIGEKTGLSLLKVTQCLDHTAEQTNLVEYSVEEDGTRHYYRRV
ncbi:hypothetical protein MUK72_09220 [Halococcus dombrowskii]|nr:hypothetical protein [Halococcus dombrowskii]UOO94150.1 hypothetical protein MUK72_09220 [Halococcus dombrowskii]